MSKIKQSLENLTLFNEIRSDVRGFHSHVSILKDLSDSIDKDTITYLEIGCFAGATACLMLQDDRVEVVSVDLGYPVSEEEVQLNIKTKSSNSKFTYIKGNSRNEDTISKVFDELGEKKVDILFIDGDHSRQAVFDDFNNYSPLVADGGYIVFDDYLDFQHSPDVYKAVNDLTDSLKGFDVIGSLDNIHGANPDGSDFRDRFSKLNEFIIRKHG